MVAGRRADPALLRPWVDRPGSSGIIFDFDGTLADIVADPAAAAPRADARALLVALSGSLARVAVVSGRPGQFLAERLGDVPRLVLVGLYGLERVEEGRVVAHPAAERWRPAVARAAAAAERSAPPGVTVERKGLSVTVHYRGAPEEEGWAAAFAAEQHAGSGLVAHTGRQSVELRPPLPVDKGTVVGELGGGLSAVCFVGDDVGDLPAYAALRRLRATGVTTLGIVAGAAEVALEVIAVADVVVDGPAGVVNFLQLLVGRGGP